MNNALSWREKAVAVGMAMAVFAMVGGMGWVVDDSENDQHRAHQRIMVDERLASLRSRLEQVLNANLTAVDGLEAFVRSCPDCDGATLDSFVAAMADGREEIRALQLAPGAVVAHVHPRPGNEASLGLDLRTLPGQAETVRRTIEDGRFRLAGPVALYQGGSGLVGRKPIYLSESEKPFWGFATVILDLPALLAKAGWQSEDGIGRFALRGADGSGAQGTAFLGDDRIFGQDPLLTEVAFPGGSWQLAGIPRQGWGYTRPAATSFRSAVVLVALLAALATALVLRLGFASRGTRRRLIEASRAKGDFMARMSHELRTPLNAVIGFSEAIATQALGPVGNLRYLEYADDIKRSGRHLLDIVNAILDLEKAEAGHLEIHAEALSPARLCRETARLMGHRAETAGIGLVTEAAPDLPGLMADPRALRQMLLNLVSNAVKFTPAGGRIRLRAATTPEGLEIAVADDGIGIAAEDIPKVLSAFGQAGGSKTRHHGGTGLGLPLTQALIALHGGRLDIRSEPGKGTVVALIFPPSRILRLRENETAPEGAVAETA
ncbi:MAG: ATP-binding protein [Magnetospirillum sp. WYHS-4]